MNIFTIRHTVILFSLLSFSIFAPEAKASLWDSTSHDSGTFISANGKAITVSVSLPDPSANAPIVSLNDKDILQESTSDYDLFRNAILKARLTNAKELIIPNRVYNIKVPPGTTDPAAIFISDVNNLTINGQGATLLFNDTYLHGLQISNSDRVVVKSLTLDWVPPMAFPGQVNHVPGSKYLYLTIDPPYIISANNPPQIRVVSAFNTATRSWFAGAGGPPIDTNFTSANLPIYKGNNTYQLPMIGASVANGTQVIATARLSGVNAVHVGSLSSNITFENITVYSSPGIAFLFKNADRGFHLTHCRVIRKPDYLLKPGEPKRLISSLADAVNFSADTENIIVENSEFANQADDGLNIHGVICPVLSVSSDRMGLIVKVPDPSNVFFAAGDYINLVDKDFNPIATAVKVSSEALNARNSDGTANVMLTLSTSTPEFSGTMFIENLSRSGTHAIVINNYYHDNRARGILIESEDALVKNNIISGMTQAGILLEAIMGTYFEGPGARDVILEDNQITNVNRAPSISQVASGIFGAVMLDSITADGSSGVDYPHHEILINDNVITQKYGWPILISSAHDVLLLNNRVNDGAMNSSNTNVVESTTKNVAVKATPGPFVGGR